MTEWTKKRRIMRRYDQSARVYDIQYHEEQEAKIETATRNLTLNENSVILDVGCGTGLLFAHLSEKTKFVVGADFSRIILKKARNKAKSQENIALTRADADNLPFANKTFDVVFAITLLQNTPNPAATLDEIKRVSKTNAIIVVTGLRKTFTEEEFSKMVNQAGLKAASHVLDEHRREFVSICTRMRR